MRSAATLHRQGVNYYELALLLAYSQVDSLDEDWPYFISRLSHICDRFARAHVPNAHHMQIHAMCNHTTTRDHKKENV